MKKLVIFSGFFLFAVTTLWAQKLENSQIKECIERYMNDARGPYKDIRWFCKDGSFVQPKEKCPEPGGVQRARYKDEVVALGKSNHIFLGQILSTTPKEDFWDAKNYNSRLKQYQLEKYLRTIDDGWVLRKGQFYRGAYQIEDEETWGIEFLQWLVGQDELINKQFFLLRQASKDIPHRGDDSKTLNVRAVSKAISDAYPAFMDLRVKIHGQPEATDIDKVKSFRDTHRSKLNANLLKQFETLLADMEAIYQPIQLGTLSRFINQIPKDAPIRESLSQFTQTFDGTQHAGALAVASAEQLAAIRLALPEIKGKKARLALIDLSNALEEIFFRAVNDWEPASLKEGMEKVCYTGQAAMGTGFIELWEWEEVQPILIPPTGESITLANFNTYIESARSLVEWGTGMVNGVYKDVINTYGGFEPKAYGFYDDRVRASVLLPLGNTVGQLGALLAKESKLTNRVFSLSNQSTFRGLNPGIALGELVVVRENEEELAVSKDKIYVFHHPPSDLKPVAGILTVTEGNMVSHVQLLARNLAIPNAVLSLQNMEDLDRFAGQQVFFAVSNSGTLVMKKAADMSKEEKALFAEKKRSDERITVPTEKIDLGQQAVLNMRNVNAASSGKLCGPKAANLGQLKAMFPENVVEGLVLPFGVFRQHMDQPMPGQQGSYWDFLNRAFVQAAQMRNENQSDEAIENYSLAQLEILREAIKKMALLPAFVSDLERSFQEVLGDKLGKVPVFLRSDTNMEDLKDFTGAGLNLTLFNVVDREKIIQGIKDVWASPYTERSFKWRQRYLLNPENVYPSILIIPSVDVEYSGVVITKGITTADERDITVAFSQGAGGAVDGQAAESYLLHHMGNNRLLSPAREPSYRRLPVSGGTSTNYATFEKPILNDRNLYDLRWVGQRTEYLLAPEEEGAVPGPFDIELGFQEDKIWLFQIRPFVENKNAVSSSYLESISPKVDDQQLIKLNQALN